MPASDAFTSFDAAMAAQAGIDAQRQPQLQRYTNPTAPNPHQLVSDHEAHGAWLPAARAIPQEPHAPPMWVANHDGVTVPYDQNAGDKFGTLAARPSTHGGNDDNYADPSSWGDNYAQPNTYGNQVNIGRPYLKTETRQRHLRTDQWDSQGRIINPPDAPSAPMQIWNSEHDTEPRWIGFDVAPLFSNIGKGPQFSTNPGYLGVSDNQPNRSPRQWGSEAAQMPDDPYVAQGSSAGGSTVDYSWDF